MKHPICPTCEKPIFTTEDETGFCMDCKKEYKITKVVSYVLKEINPIVRVRVGETIPKILFNWVCPINWTPKYENIFDKSLIYKDGFVSDTKKQAGIALYNTVYKPGQEVEVSLDSLQWISINNIKLGKVEKT